MSGDLSLIKPVEEVKKNDLALARGEKLVDYAAEFGPQSFRALQTLMLLPDVSRFLVMQTVLGGELSPAFLRDSYLPEIGIELGQRSRIK